MRYEVTMSDGAVGEAHTLRAALCAAETMYDDAGGGVRVKDVRVSSDRPWKVGSGRAVREHVLWACNQHLREHRQRIEAAGGYVEAAPCGEAAQA